MMNRGSPGGGRLIQAEMYLIYAYHGINVRMLNRPTGTQNINMLIISPRDQNGTSWCNWSPWALVSILCLYCNIRQIFKAFG